MKFSTKSVLVEILDRVDKDKLYVELGSNGLGASFRGQFR